MRKQEKLKKVAEAEIAEILIKYGNGKDDRNDGKVEEILLKECYKDGNIAERQKILQKRILTQIRKILGRRKTY